MTTIEHEHTLNVWLAEALKSQRLNAVAERSEQGRRIDVRVRVGSTVVAVEAKQGQNPGKRVEAVGDADARLSQNLAAVAIAVCYPEGTTPETLPTAELLWTVRDPSSRDAFNSVWSTGGVERLATAARLAPMQLGDPDVVAGALSDSLNVAVDKLSESQKRALSHALDLPQGRALDDGQGGRTRWHQGAKRALLVVATAVMFHSRLNSHLADSRPEYDNRSTPRRPFTDAWPPQSAPVCADSSDPIGAFLAAWNLILALDYKPIFETARTALNGCAHDSAFGEAVRLTAEAAMSTMRSVASLRHDLQGRIFHAVLDTARYDGSFYTSTPGATLLAALAITEEMCDWSSPEAIRGIRITDPACGTGTLLMAAAERIRELTRRYPIEAKVSQSLIEDVLTGYDINLTATHMAATTLGLLSPTTLFRNMKIGRAFLGVDGNDKAWLGSLEFLDSNPMLMDWPNAQRGAAQVENGERMANAEPADLVIMNPPFTRDSLRHDQFSREDERKIKEREKELFANQPTYMAGNSGAFLVLADYISKRDSGTLAVVLPVVAATDRSGLGIRRFLAKHYHVETIVTSHDPERTYFSENTSIGEMLLVCRRWPKSKGAKPPTRVVNLWVNPDTPEQAVNVAWAIADGTAIERSIATVYQWPESRIAAGDWGGVQFFVPYLSLRFVDLRSGTYFPVVALGEIADIGPAGRRIRDAFTRTTSPVAERKPALWQHDTSVTQSMAAEPDSYIVAKEAKAHLAERYWEQRGTMLLPNRMRLNTARVCAVRLSQATVGSSWTPCNINTGENKEALEKAVCVFLNSSIGALSLLGDRTNRVLSYPRFSIDDLRKLIVPDFGEIGADAVAELAAAYDEHAADMLLPLPEMEWDPTRKALDAAVQSALGMDGELVYGIRETIGMEPAVMGRRYEGMAGRRRRRR